MDKDINKKLDAILDAIQGLDARVTKIETGMAGAGGGKTGARASTKKTEIRKFLLENTPPDDTRRTLAIGYFLENQEGMSSFTPQDLLKGYDDAKARPPSNISVNLARLTEDGHIMKAREKKGNKTAYVLTDSGEKFVDDGYRKADGKKK